MQIYRNDYSARLQGALETHYPIIARIVGSELFSQIAQDYLARYPSRTWDLDQIGESLPLYLESEQALSLKETLPFIVDIARLEWESHRYFHEASTASLESLPHSEEELATLQLQKDLRVFESAYQIPEIYRAAQRQQAHWPDRWEQPSWYFLGKENFLVQLEDINDEEFLFLKLWQQQRSFEAALSEITTSIDTDTSPFFERLGHFLIRLNRFGLLRRS